MLTRRWLSLASGWSLRVGMAKSMTASTHLRMGSFWKGSVVQGQLVIRLRYALSAASASLRALKKSHARRDLVIWGKPFQNSRISDGESECLPLAFMEWEAKFWRRLPKTIFYPHDEDWVARYTAAHERGLGG